MPAGTGTCPLTCFTGLAAREAGGFDVDSSDVHQRHFVPGPVLEFGNARESGPAIA
jgi:hypothetical protein